MSDSIVRTPGVSEEHAHRLLARAVALDAQHRDALSLVDLRAAAIEAGIDGRAFDRAVAELGPEVSPSATASVAVPSRWVPVTSNLKAAFTFWVTLTILTRLGHLVPADWTVSAIRNVLATGVGVWFAFRFRATIVRLGLTGIGVAQVSLLLIHLVFGIDAAQGGPTQFAVLIAGLLGVTLPALGRLLAQLPGGSVSASGALIPAFESAPEEVPTSSVGEPRDPPPFRLVRVAAV